MPFLSAADGRGGQHHPGPHPEPAGLRWDPAGETQGWGGRVGAGADVEQRLAGRAVLTQPGPAPTPGGLLYIRHHWHQPVPRCHRGPVWKWQVRGCPLCQGGLVGPGQPPRRGPPSGPFFPALCLGWGCSRHGLPWGPGCASLRACSLWISWARAGGCLLPRAQPCHIPQPGPCQWFSTVWELRAAGVLAQQLR